MHYFSLMYNWLGPALRKPATLSRKAKINKSTGSAQCPILYNFVQKVWAPFFGCLNQSQVLTRLDFFNFLGFIPFFSGENCWDPYLCIFLIYLLNLSLFLLVSTAVMNWVLVCVILDLFTTQFSEKVFIGTWNLIEYDQHKLWEGFGWFLQMYRNTKL